MVPTPRTRAAVLAAALWTQLAVATRVAFMSESTGSGIITFMAPNITQAIACYDLSDYGELPSVQVLDSTPGLAVNFFPDSQCQGNSTVFHTDGYLSASEVAFGSWSITKDTPKSANTTDLVATAPGSIKMGNYQEFGLTGPHTDVSLSIPLLAALLLTATGSGITTIYATVVACSEAAQTGEVNDILACISVPIATICSFTGGYLYKHAGASVVANTAIDMATGTITNLNGPNKRSAIDSALHDYLSVLPNSSYVGHMYHAAYEHPRPMYEVEPVPGHRMHFSAFIGDGFITHHMHYAQETEKVKRAQGLDKRDPPYPYDGIRYSENGFDWNMCVYSQSTSSNWDDSPSYDYNTFYDQLTCVIDSPAPYQSAQAMQIDLYDISGTLSADIEIRPYSGSSATANAPACSATPPPINGDYLNRKEEEDGRGRFQSAYGSSS
ncbi:hypothetical protein M409DRAFT_55608 [Zasmidium cellare ATCC 36951]|uniref:Uncharacterized protein n=1 Tax=Zasmidium cellare ATCC 36951 TaxID=1080233 RepID=A0A6A6CET5_ZASCE|nr:uncharacterized protein M409DRAFT_55608 [Zasmidium cellare ATCC 36951]KAF2165727.1 hypothetical protein M409DRAFT_55608 [Zasmidium cellare ATCC 36951]